MKRVLLYSEQGYSQEVENLVEVARQLYGEGNFTTYALVIHDDVADSEGHFDVILHLSDDRLHGFDQRAICDVVTEVHNRYHFDAILFLATPMGRCIAPRVAMRLDTGLVADVTDIAHDDGDLVLIRPAYSGKIMAGIRITGDGPVMMSVRTGVFSNARTRTGATEHIQLEGLSYQYGAITMTGKKGKEVSYDIRKSTVLVSGGAGVSDMQELHKLATLLKGEVSASRSVVDAGIVSRAMQVGQSGKTVSPQLYFALGIHGSIQHVAGLKDVPYIISVNTDRKAPICSISDIVVEGDALQFVHRLVQRIERG